MQMTSVGPLIAWGQTKCGRVGWAVALQIDDCTNQGWITAALSWNGLLSLWEPQPS